MSIWLLLSVLVAFLGHDTKLGFLGWFLISVVFSPILGFIGLYLFKKYAQKQPITSAIDSAAAPAAPSEVSST